LFYYWKKYPKDLRRGDFKGMVVSPTVADGFFDALSGRDVLLALASDIIPTMTVNTLSSLFRVIKKEKAFDYLVMHISKLAGKDYETELTQILKKSPMIGGKNDVTRLFFLARLSVIHEMERDYMKETGRKGKCLFEANLREAVNYGVSELVSVVSAVPTPPAGSNKKQKVDIALVK
jgi:hypothetical protein